MKGKTIDYSNIKEIKIGQEDIITKHRYWIIITTHDRNYFCLTYGDKDKRDKVFMNIEGKTQ